MAQFSVKPNRARMAADAEESLIHALGSISEEILSISGDLGYHSASAEAMRMRLVSVADKIIEHQEGMSSMHAALVDVVDLYERTENTILGNAKVQDVAAVVSQAGSVLAGAISGFGIKLKPIDADAPEGGFHFNVDNDWRKDYRRWGNPEDPGLSTSFGYGWQGSLMHNEISNEYGSLSIAAGAYEAYADIGAGLYTKDEKGNYVFNASIDAKVGASISVLTMAANGTIGNEMAGAHLGGTINMGKVATEGSLSVGLLDENGAFDPHFKAGASAEAILAEAEGKAGATVLGTDIDLKGSVYVGAGAHADIKFGDGKIKCDIGAALGIGGSISFEIDFSGTGDAVRTAASHIADGIASLFGW